MCWDRFDICEAYLVFAHNILCISGGKRFKSTVQIFRLYRCHFDASYHLRHWPEPKHLSVNGKAIYAQLVRKYFGGEK